MNMPTETKAKIVATTVEVLLFKGIPAAADLLNSLRDKKEITIEDLERLKGELDSRKYFGE